jgi:hypothetical protein
MNPPSLVIAVDLCPDMVFTIPHPADSGTSSATQHTEAVGKLSCPSSPGLEQCPDLAVSRKSFESLAAKTGTLV